ncbi:hypothetical protein IYV58_27910 (plasmid) [Klebsiella sp. BDA134-6]|uniref:hypothetical protein n=1 Tax=Klebsiella sp. BDA134-6 TaxID=2787706 RepID=UPI00189FE1EE|nr:hypothetical protein [Klebsiella sp. BDA134-6]QPF30508.1 hypothetical protein IYV58_27910 [Klebsiella sp. BDA134-6]
MFRYFALRFEQQLLCYLSGGVLAVFLTILIPSVTVIVFVLILVLSTVVCWTALALYICDTDQVRKTEVSPQVRIRDGIQVVATLPRHEKARIEWGILRDDEVFRQQRRELVALTGRVIRRGLLYAPAVMLVGTGILACSFPQDAVRLVSAFRTLPAAELVHQAGFVLRSVLLISVISVLTADVVAGRGLPNVFRRALLDRLPAEAWRIRRGTER